MEESESEQDSERSLSRREFNEQIDRLLNLQLHLRKSGSRGKGAEALCCTRHNGCNQQLLIFELKSRGCMPRTRNWKQI